MIPSLAYHWGERQLQIALDLELGVLASNPTDELDDERLPVIYLNL